MRNIQFQIYRITSHTHFHTVAKSSEKQCELNLSMTMSNSHHWVKYVQVSDSSSVFRWTERHIELNPNFTSMQGVYRWFGEKKIKTTYICS